MCSIVGMLLPTNMDARKHRWAIMNFKRTFAAASMRGRDGYGFAYMQKSNTVIHERKLASSADSVDGVSTDLFYDLNGWVIGNCLAAPTTEFFGKRSETDLQPFKTPPWYVVHNGTIANDDELRKEYNLLTESKVDSAVIGDVLPRLGIRLPVRDWKERVKRLTEALTGSYAIAMASEYMPNTLILVCNYKPIFIAKHRVDNHVIFASLPEFFPGWTQDGWSGEYEVHQLQPYSAVLLEATAENVEIVPYNYGIETNPGLRRALVVCSGGLDSTVAAMEMQRKGYDITLLHFQYQCKAQEKEMEAIKEIATRLGCDFVTMSTDIFKNVIKGSSLMDDSTASIVEGNAGAEYAHEWVPARNLIMLSLATGYAESHGYDVIALGTNLEESGAYPDNEMIFIKKLNEVLPYAVNVDAHVSIEMPVGHLMKHEIVRLGHETGAPIDVTWSCYHNGDQHCGVCGPCIMRRKAFQMEHLKDPISYQKTLGGK